MAFFCRGMVVTKFNSTRRKTEIVARVKRYWAKMNREIGGFEAEFWSIFCGGVGLRVFLQPRTLPALQVIVAAKLERCPDALAEIEAGPLCFRGSAALPLFTALTRSDQMRPRRLADRKAQGCRRPDVGERPAATGCPYQIPASHAEQAYDRRDGPPGRSPPGAWLLTRLISTTHHRQRANTQGAVGSSTRKIDRYTSAARPEAMLTAVTRLTLS